jgi:L-iditol 2-dehydrogenase
VSRHGRLADAVIVCPGSPAVLGHGVDTAGADATVLMFTPIEPDERFSFDQSTAYFRDVRLVSSYSCGPDDTADALGFIETGSVTADRLEITEFPFPAVESAYEAMRVAEVVKAIVTFPDDAGSVTPEWPVPLDD